MILKIPRLRLQAEFSYEKPSEARIRVSFALQILVSGQH